MNQAEISVRFFVDERGTRGGISLTDELLSLKEDFQYGVVVLLVLLGYSRRHDRRYDDTNHPFHPLLPLR